MSRAIVSQHETNRSGYGSYITGYILSLLCTLTAYLLVVRYSLSKWVLVYVLAGLAIVQFLIQMRLFLHLGKEAKPRLKLLVFGFMALVVLILVFGTLWIMYNLNYRMPTQAQINSYMQAQNGGF
jgi:cytochrome o ubiquinol oxidase operon protein cyoD